MPKVKKTSTSQSTSRTFTIPNKLYRQSHNARLKSALATSKRQERFDRKKAESKDPSLREKRLADNIPDTIERKRVWDETIPGAVVPSEAPGDDNDEAAALAAHEASQAEAAEKEETEALFPMLAVPPTQAPRILLTTSRHNHTHDQVEELAALFPNATYVPRPNDLSLKEICKIAAAPSPPREAYSHVILANVDAKKVDALTVIVLPAGPSFKFSLSNYVPTSRISGHGRPTSHIPELIFNNFLTPLGKNTAGVFQSLFPQLPEFRGRQVVTLHNQRDFIFFRRHRYVFREKRETEKEVGYGLDSSKPQGGKGMEGLGVKVGLQELGPRFTLKLRRVQKGIQENVVWQWRAGMEKQRTKFNL